MVNRAFTIREKRIVGIAALWLGFLIMGGLVSSGLIDKFKITTQANLNIKLLRSFDANLHDKKGYELAESNKHNFASMPVNYLS